MRTTFACGFVASMAGALFALGCEPSETSETPREKTARLEETSTASLTIQLPDGVDVEDVGLVANGSLTMRDRSSFVDASGASPQVFNVGSTATEIGAEARVGALDSLAPVLLRSRALVQGDVRSAGTVQSQAGAQVTGTSTSHAALPPSSSLSWDAPLEAAPTQSRTVAPDGVLELEPGAYGTLTVFSRGRLKLRSGNYAFTSLRLEPDAILDATVTPDAGPVVLYVDDVEVARGRLVSTSSSSAEGLLLVHRGTRTLRLERSAGWTIVAPHATVELATGGAAYAGSIYAQGIHLEPDVRLFYVPFRYWSWVLPPQPSAACVFSAGGGQWVAAFGYQNRPHASVEVPAGPRNFLTPDPGPSFPPITRFQPGEVPEALWVPMPETGITWTLQGRSVTADLGTRRCEFPAPPADAPGPASEGRPLPRPSVPSVPAPRQDELALENASGPGRFVLTADARSAVLFSGVADPKVGPAQPGVPPDVPDGLTLEPLVPLTLSIETTLPGDSIFEGNDLRVWSSLAGPDQSWENVPTPGGVGHYSLTVDVPQGSVVPIELRQVEYNLFSDHEAMTLDLSVDLATGTITGTQESAVINKTWVAPLPIVIDDYHLLASTPVTGKLGQIFTFPFHGSNTARWSLHAPPVLSGTTRLCANWTAYFVDEGQPTPDGVTEQFTGMQLDDGLRVRGYRASFAEFHLTVKGALASYRGAGRLDRDGCVEVPRVALLYDDSVRDGSAGGISLHLELLAQLETPQGARFPVEYPNGKSIRKVLHLTSFDDEGGWSWVNGYRVPTDEVVLTQPFRDHGSTVAASISHSLRRLTAEGVALPPGSFPTKVNSGSDVGTRDYLGNVVLDSMYAEGTLSIGPAFFPCGTPATSSDDCRRACQSDAQCAGGQHCAHGTNPSDGCQGELCFCAYADQGTMKFVTTHELGHMLQDIMTGGGPPIYGRYDFACQPDPSAPGTCLRNLGRLEPTSPFPHQLLDPPLMNESCGCQHVAKANGLHCLQSIERPDRADSEGFAQFFSAWMWNDDGNCRFNYYKEFLDSEPGAPCRISGDPLACSTYPMRNGQPATVTLPPVPIDCSTPVRWRNRHQCVVDDRLDEGLAKPFMGTEYDWMTFLFVLNARIGFNELMSLYNHACHPSYIPNPHDADPTNDVETPCGQRTPAGVSASPIAWRDGEIATEIREGVVASSVMHGGMVSGARRKWGEQSSLPLLVEDLGNLHGVGTLLDPP